MKRKFTNLAILALLLFAVNTVAQQPSKTVNGKVTSFEESFALVGVQVHVKGTENHTGTRADGSFSIGVSRQNQVLVFELAGYEMQEINAGDVTQVNVVLKRTSDAAQALDTRRDDLAVQGIRTN